MTMPSWSFLDGIQEISGSGVVSNRFAMTEELNCALFPLICIGKDTISRNLLCPIQRPPATEQYSEEMNRKIKSNSVPGRSTVTQPTMWYLYGPIADRGRSANLRTVCTGGLHRPRRTNSEHSVCLLLETSHFEQSVPFHFEHAGVALQCGSNQDRKLPGKKKPFKTLSQKRHSKKPAIKAKLKYCCTQASLPLSRQEGPPLCLNLTRAGRPQRLPKQYAFLLWGGGGLEGRN